METVTVEGQDLHADRKVLHQFYYFHCHNNHFHQHHDDFDASVHYDFYEYLIVKKNYIKYKWKNRPVKINNLSFFKSYPQNYLTTPELMPESVACRLLNDNEEVCSLLTFPPTPSISASCRFRLVCVITS